MEREFESESLAYTEHGPHGGHHHHTDHKVSIQINRVHHEVHVFSSGRELYRIGDVGSRFGLYREGEGERKDKLVRDTDEPVHLHGGEHFYSEQTQFNVIVNLIEETVSGDHLSFEQIIKLAFNAAPNTDITSNTVTFENGGGRRPEGTLTAGHELHIQDGTVISVTPTNKS